MINIVSAKSRMDRIYREPEESIYKQRFFQDLCTGYSYRIGEKRDFFSFEPKDSRIEKLITKKGRYNLNYEMERLIDKVTYSLMLFGKAYIRIIPDYSEYVDAEGKKNKELSLIEMSEIKGFIRKRKKKTVVFCYKNFTGDIKAIDIERNQLIEFDIRELGYRRSFFTDIVKALGKCDITKTSTAMVFNDEYGYDYTVHSKKRKLKELQITKELGWSFGTDGLSESYILYKKIQGDKLRLKFLNYILENINNGLNTFVDDAGGKLVAHIKNIDYDRLWNDYSTGKITGLELSGFLYSSVE